MMNLRINWRLCCLGLFLALNFLLWYALAWEDRRGILTVAILDIGQGDAIFIDAPNGNQVLVDGGSPNGKILAGLGRVMPFYDRGIDVVLGTHNDMDHVGGLEDVSARYSVGYDGKPRGVIRGTQFDLGGGIILDVLWPVGGLGSVSDHDAMLVAKLQYGSTIILLTGDMEKNLERHLVSVYGRNLESDVLKVGHHGSRTSSGEEFLGYVNPSLAVISSGAGNPYGHPHAEVLERLKRFDIPFMRTDQSGTIVLKSDSEKFTAGVE